MASQVLSASGSRSYATDSPAHCRRRSARVGVTASYTPPQIAQLLTIKRERTLAAGVGKRDARKAEKKEKVDAGFGQF